MVCSLGLLLAPIEGYSLWQWVFFAKKNLTELKQTLLIAWPRGANLHKGFKFLYARSSVCPSPLVLVSSYTAIIPRTPYTFSDSEPPIKWLIGVQIIGDPNPPKPPSGGFKVFFGGYEWLTILNLMEPNIFGKLLTFNIILVILGE